MQIVNKLALCVAFSVVSMPGRLAGCAEPGARGDSSIRPIEVRPFRDEVEGHWIGEAVSIDFFREGQRPGGVQPTREQIEEDLRIVAKHWRLIRTYGAKEVTETMLKIIREENLPLKVMLGAWVNLEKRALPEEVLSEGRKEMAAKNPREITAAIRLANQFPEIVIALSIGNETQVEWSGHRVDPDILIRYIQKARAETQIPVTTADDFMFWETEESKKIAAEVDFIVTHIHPAWKKQKLANAVEFVDGLYRAVQEMHPDRLIVLGETGWPTNKLTTGLQARLILGKVGEPEQAVFYNEIKQWTNKNKVTTFYFQAFDGKWKGASGEPDHVEKHWGVFNADRTPKQAMNEPAQ